MAEPDVDEDLFADLYDGDDTEAPSNHIETEPEPPAPENDTQAEPEPESMPVIAAGSMGGIDESSIKPEHMMGGMDGMHDIGDYQHSPPEDRPIGVKEDGKMFIGGLNWETTDESLKNYFSQFGEVIECTVMRDGATGRSRGFGFLTFKDPKVVNTVMVKEHQLDNKLIDPKRAIPREEQERTAKIFVGGVSQDATEEDFKDFFKQFGRVLDATLMMDKDTGRPRGFGFVTFDNEMAVERTLEGPLAILGKPIEVKRAQPRGKMGEEEPSQNKFGRGGKASGQQWSNGGGNFNQGANQMPQSGGDGSGGNGNQMTPAMMAQYWQRMQQYFAMMAAQNGMGGGGMNMMGGMNPMMAQMMQQRGMNPQMMQQMMQQQGVNPQQMQQMMQNNGGGNSPVNGGAGGGTRPGFSAQEQLMFEQQKYERQQMARMQQGNFAGGNTWDGMYDDVPAPAGMQGGPTGPRGGGGGGRGGRGGRGGGGGGGAGVAAPTGQAPANAPTGPKNAGKPGANYRGGGRGGHRGFHPYSRGGG